MAALSPAVSAALRVLWKLHQSATTRAPARSIAETQLLLSRPCRRNAATMPCRTRLGVLLLGPRKNGGTRTRDRSAERPCRERGLLHVGKARNQHLALRLDHDVE